MEGNDEVVLSQLVESCASARTSAQPIQSTLFTLSSSAFSLSRSLSLALSLSLLSLPRAHRKLEPVVCLYDYLTSVLPRPF